MMIRSLTILSSFGLIGLAATSANAQADDRKLIIYGADRCPANTICVRAPESERFRIPKSIRENTPNVGDDWAARGASVASAGAASGTGSCTNTGAGGWTGCWAKQMKDARAERKAKKEQDLYPDAK